MRGRILVTGGTGLVGTALGRSLEAAGYDDVVLVGSKDADLRQRDQAERLLDDTRPSTVFHLAGRVYGLMGNLDNRSQVFVDNMRINTNVIDACRISGVDKVVGMGSTAVYSDDVPLPMSETDLWLGQPHDSEFAYAHTKRAMLAHLMTCASDGGPCFAYAVATNLYGTHDRFDEAWGHVIPSLVSKFQRAASQGTRVEVWGSGTATRDFLYCDDAAEALRAIGERGKGVTNVATGISTTIRSVVELLADIAAYDNIVWDDSKPDGQAARQYDVTRLNALGFRPRWSLEDGLRSAYEWYQANLSTARR